MAGQRSAHPGYAYSGLAEGQLVFFKRRILSSIIFTISNETFIIRVQAVCMQKFSFLSLKLREEFEVTDE